MIVAMIAITTKSSTRVNPGDRRFLSFHMGFSAAAGDWSGHSSSLSRSLHKLDELVARLPDRSHTSHMIATSLRVVP
jgi:hypothetical protein